MIGSQLQSIRLKNFKAVRDSGEVKLTPLTVFIGNNGSGKSSLIEGLQTYQQILRSGLDSALARWRGFENVHNPPLNFSRPAGDKREKIQPIEISLRGAAYEGGSYQTWMKIDISENGDDVLIAEERLNIRNRRVLERNVRGEVEYEGQPIRAQSAAIRLVDVSADDGAELRQTKGCC